MLFINDYNINDEKNEVIIKIIGTKGNDYLIKISQNHMPECNCIDYKIRKSVCKHIIYSLSKIGKIKFDNKKDNVFELNFIFD